MPNFALCEDCHQPVPAEHVVRDGNVYILKECPECGENEALVSSHADRWQRKRDIWGKDPDQGLQCTLQCERCAINHYPRMVFMDITNRCNMNCPICIANIPGMGFEFNPPLQYFEHVLDGLAQMNPKPVVQLFGGEPTVRNDMFDIVEMARERGLKVRVVTNGLRLADEDYCKKVCEARLPVLLAFDGNSPEIYEKLRKNPSAYEKKLKALENLEKYSQRKNTIMCCVGRGINDRHMGGLIELCHESRDFIKCLHLIPLTETWEEGEFYTDAATTTEDVEQIIDEAIAGSTVEFVSAGLVEHLSLALKFFNASPPRFGGAHPNCESATYLLSDGQKYRPIGDYLKLPLEELAARVVKRSQKIEPLLSRLNPHRFAQRQLGRAVAALAFTGLLVGSLNLRKLFNRHPLRAIPGILAGLLTGRRLKDLVRKYSDIETGMLMIVLPFEEYHSVEASRLQRCPAGFVYEDADTGAINTIPVCIWGEYKTKIQRRIAEKYATEAESAELPKSGVQRAGAHAD